ncbi:tetratricopeptide repeat protein [Streptomyces sp. NPDC058371]|uniref:tetratricopeptide repeat protein n=1 Tax=Streptomyces sp. NPDC058371 TaxID=3346463 RepID=UPI00365A6D09
MRALNTAAHWFFLALAALVALGLVHGASALVHRMRARGRILPLVLLPAHATDENGAATPTAHLTARLAAHLAEHGGESILAPGSPSAATADSGPQTSAPAQGWVDSLLRIALASPSGYAVQLRELERAGDLRRVAVHILRVPKNRIIAAAVITEADPETLVEKIAVYCIVQVRNQPQMLRRIPRWERWDAEGHALTHYRRGVDEQRRDAQSRAGEQSPGADYTEALLAFTRAVKFAPGNLLIRHGEAALIELMHAHHPDDYQRAIAIYQRCTELWPEHIETAYRMAIAYSRAARPLLRDRNLRPEDMARLEEPAVLARAHLADICLRLRLRPLLRNWLRSSIPGGWSNSGERRYWGAWLMPLPLPARRSQRRTFLGAIRIALAAHNLPQSHHRARADTSAGATGRRQRDVSTAFDIVAREILVRTWFPARGTGMRRLLHADHSTARSAHDATTHGIRTNPRATARHWGPERKGSAGWMTHYNAACFLALAATLPDESLPTGYARCDWQEDCTRSALHQLDHSWRAADSTLTGDWIAHDPDLDPLWATGSGRDWAQFMNIDIPPTVRPLLPPRRTPRSSTGAAR